MPRRMKCASAVERKNKDRIKKEREGVADVVNLTCLGHLPSACSKSDNGYGDNIVRYCIHKVNCRKKGSQIIESEGRPSSVLEQG